MKKTIQDNLLKICTTIVTLIIIVIFFSACEKELNIRPDDFPQMLVINGIVEQDSLFVVNVTRTGGLNENFMVADLFLSDAIVSLYDGDVFLETMIHDSLGFYTSTSYATGGHSYSIRVEKDDYPSATAYLDFSEDVQFGISNFYYESTDTIRTYDVPEPGGEVLLHEFHVYYDLSLSDNAEVNNFYSFSAITKMQEVMIGNYNEEDEEVELGDLMYMNAGVTMELWADWEKYNQDFYGSYLYGSIDFGFNAIDDKIFNGQTENFNFFTFFRTSEISDFSIVVKSYPEGIIKYLESLELYWNTYDNPFSEPVNIYSNVENGIGFVCGVPSSKNVFDIE